MKNFKKVLALVLAVVMLLSFATVASAADSTSYKDVDDIDYTEAVDVLSAIGILDGFPDKTFRPEANITRAQAAKIIAMFDNKSTDISSIYTSANPFTDCVGSWAESYIAYGAKTGILAGVGNLKFAPNDNVTGTQFLKMALVVLGYDAKAEELEGKNWDVNTLALAKRVGLTAGFAKTHNFKNALTRQEAALIMLNALRAGTVEYGSKFVLAGLKWNKEDDRYYLDGKGNSPYMTIAGACLTGDKLMKDWDLSEDYTYDAFMRPYRTWKLGKKQLGQTYMIDPSATFTTAYNACDLLVALGIPTGDTANTATVVKAWINGHKVHEDYPNYGTLRHSKVAYHDNCEMTDANHVAGAQGTLTQVFYLTADQAKAVYGKDFPAGYYVTEIDTFLAQVTKTYSKTTNQEGHIVTSTEATLDVFGGDHTGRLGYEFANTFSATTTEAGLTKGDYVLVRLSDKDTNAQGNVYNVVELYTPETKTGSFDGLRTVNLPEETRIDGEFVPNALHFHLNKDAIWAVRDYGTKVFFFDTYGNVIGMKNPDAAAAQYLTINGLWLEYVHGTGVAEWHADVVTMDGEMHKNVTVAKLAGKTGDEWVTTYLSSGYSAWEARVVMSGWYHQLFTFTTTKDGEYVINTVDYKKAAGTASFTKGETNVMVGEALAFSVDNSTQFLIHENDKSYKAVTGYKTLDSMMVKTALYIDNDNDGYADIVYFCEPTRNNDTFYAYFDGHTREYSFTANGIEYQGYVVYVDGVKTVVYQPTTDGSQLCDINGYDLDLPLWVKLTYHNDGDIEYVTVAACHAGEDTKLDALNNRRTVSAVADGALTFDGVKYDYVDGVKIFFVDTDRRMVKAADAEYKISSLAGETDVAIVLNGAGDVAEIYVYGGWHW